MSEKARDGQGRWRSKTIAFRISPEENKMLEDFVRLSGLTKQEYLIQRALNRDVSVIPNPRVHKALREQMHKMCEEFHRLHSVNDLSPEMLAVFEMTSRIFEGLGSEK